MVVPILIVYLYQFESFVKFKFQAVCEFYLISVAVSLYLFVSCIGPSGGDALLNLLWYVFALYCGEAVAYLSPFSLAVELYLESVCKVYLISCIQQFCIFGYK